MQMKFEICFARYAAGLVLYTYTSSLPFPLSALVFQFFSFVFEIFCPFHQVNVVTYLVDLDPMINTFDAKYRCMCRQ